MAWNHDLSPTEYLEQRLRYYKSKLTWANNLIIVDVVKNKVVWKVRPPYGDRKIWTVSNIKKYQKRLEIRVNEYQTALKILTTQKV